MGCKISVVDIPAVGWTAGGVYTRTAASALGAAADLRPGTQIFRVSKDSDPIAGVTHLPMPDVDHALPGERLVRWAAQRGTRGGPLPGERRVRQLLSLPDPHDPVWVSQKLGMHVAFPVLAVPRRTAHMGMVGWIPDLQHIHFPQFFSSTEVTSRTRQFRLLGERCQRLVFSSDTVRSEFEQHFSELKGKTRTLHFPSRFTFEAPEEIDVAAIYGLPRRYFLCVNQFWRHKNHRLVLQAIAEAASQQPEIACVFTGLPIDGRDPENSYLSELLQFIATHRLGSNARVLGLVPKAHLGALIRGAAGLIQPSLSEGWNTSVEDAKALGTPILALDTPVLREQAPHATFFGTDPADLAHALLHPVQDREAPASGRSHAAQTAGSFGPTLLDLCLEVARDAKTSR